MNLLADHSNQAILNHFETEVNLFNLKKIDQWLPTELKSELDAQLGLDQSTTKTKALFKLFNPYAAGKWYLSSLDMSTGLFFGFAHLGDSMMAELGSIRFHTLFEYYTHHPFLHIERDELYCPTSLATIIHKCKNENILL